MTTRLPRTTSRNGLSFSRMPSWRMLWLGWMKVRPTYAFLTRPTRYGMPDSSAYPIAAGMPDSGTPITRSASTGCSRARVRPMATRAEYMLRPAITLSGRARYTYSNRQPFGSGVANRLDRRPSSPIESSSPGSTSRTKLAPTVSRAAVSLATTQPRSIRPSTNGRTPYGSRAA